MDIVESISSLLDSGKYKEALSAPSDEKYQAAFKDNCWDLIPVIIGKVQDDTVVLKPSLHSTCEQLLSQIATRAHPEEALLEFIERIEEAKNDAQFMMVLGPLQQLLKKLTIKRGRSLEWSLNSISTYINAIPVPEYNLEGKERLLMDSDSNIRRIVKLYTHLSPFYKPFIFEVIGDSSNVNLKQNLTSFLVGLLGKPLIYIDLDPEQNAQSEARTSATTILQDICLLEKDVLKFLYYLDYKCKEKVRDKKKTNDDSEEPHPYLQTEKLNITSLSGLYYVVLSNHFQIPDGAIPQVYNLEYIVHTAFLAVHHLLNFVAYGPLAKGISLCKALLNKLTYPVSHTLLTSPVHYQLCKDLVNVAVFSTYESLRKEAVTLVNCHTNKFEYKGRCMLIRCLLNISDHSGMIGFVITMYKNSLNEAFKLGEPLPECFTGPQLMSMIEKICHLPNGHETDLVELADQIITSLNFVRFLALMDTSNKTGVRECFPYIENIYLKELRAGLNMSKAHYEIKLQDLKEGRKEEVNNVAVTVGGNVLDSIPIESKKEIILSALNAFHLMEGLTARVTECISLNKSSNESESN